MLKFRERMNEDDFMIRSMVEVIAEGETKFQSYIFFRSKLNGVCVALDGDIQSCESDEALYHEALVHPAMLLSESPKNVLIMGGGEGSTAREVLKHSTVEKVVMVDIDREFVELCKQHIPDWGAAAFSDPKLKIYYHDIREYVVGADKKFDVVIGDLVDVRDWDSQLAGLYEDQFYANLKSVMSADGIIATQGGYLTCAESDGHAKIRAGLASNFAQVASYGVTVPSFYAMWGFALAHVSGSVPDDDLAGLFSRRAKRRRVDLTATGAKYLASAFNLPRAISKTYI